MAFSIQPHEPPNATSKTTNPSRIKSSTQEPFFMSPSSISIHTINLCVKNLISSTQIQTTPKTPRSIIHVFSSQLKKNSQSKSLDNNNQGCALNS